MIRKTAAVTAISIAGVVLAGSAAVGANIGILDAADDTGLGTLSAEAAIASPAESTSTTTLEASPATSTVTVAPSDDADVQTFAVDVAGTVDLETDDTGLHLKAVDATDGWSWTETSSGTDTVAVMFTSGSDTLEFVAALNADGTIDARVDRPVVVFEPAPATPGTTPAAGSVSGEYGDDDEYDHDEGDDHDEHEDHEDEDHEDDDHEDDDHDEHEHEGGDDDD